MPRWPKYSVVGETYNRLTVISQSIFGSAVTLLCRCSCGKSIYTARKQVLSGAIKSCGCLRVESRYKNIKHGLAGRNGKSPEYYIWAAMRQRCNNPKNKGYKDYGGRGITVCSRWDRFENFLSDMGRRPNPKLSLDRRDNDRGYYPDNCRWATRLEQNNNRRSKRP